MLSGLRSKLIFLVVVAMIPGFISALAIANQQRIQARQEAEKTSQSFLRLVTLNQTQLVNNVRGLATTLAQVIDIHAIDAPRCEALLQQVLDKNVGYSGFVVSDVQGKIMCSAPKVTTINSIADRPFFQQAISDKGFAVPGFAVGRQSYKGFLSFGYPMLDAQGQVVGVIGTGIHTDWLNQSIRDLNLPEGWVVNIVDHSGTVLARWPEPDRFVGTRPTDIPVIQEMLRINTHDYSVTEELQGADGIERFYALTSLGEDSNRILISVGVSTATALADINQTLVRNLLALTFTALLGVAIAWVAGNRILLNRLTLLSQAAHNLETGQLDTRVDVSTNRDELDDLAQAFNNMAATLKTQTEELKISERNHRILANVGTTFSSSLDFAQRLNQFVQLLVGPIADWCIINVFESDQSIHQLAVAHRNAEKTALARELANNYPPNGNPAAIRDYLLEAKKSAFFPDISEADLEKTLHDERHRFLIHEVGVKGFMIVPLINQGHLLGEVTLVRAPSSPIFTEDDLNLVEELVRRAAIALDHARLFETIQNLNADLESRIVEKTLQLREAVRKLQISRNQLRGLARKQNQAIEDEQVRISREVHDGIGQSLTALKMDVVRMQQLANKNDPAVNQQAETTYKLIQSTIELTRSIARRLRPSILDDLGLGAALEWYCADTQARTKVVCQFIDQIADLHIPTEIATETYRIAQEAMTNVVRHAQATEVVVTLAADADHLVMTIQDNGVGISKERLGNIYSLGMLGMQERALRVNGKLTIDSDLGHGTTVILHIPLVAGSSNPESDSVADEAFFGSTLTGD